MLANVNALTDSEMGALHRASYSRVSLLLFYKRKKYFIDFFLNFLQLDDNHKVVEVLLKNGAKVNAQDQIRWTSLHYSAYQGYENTVSFIA